MEPAVQESTQKDAHPVFSFVVLFAFVFVFIFLVLFLVFFLFLSLVLVGHIKPRAVTIIVGKDKDRGVIHLYWCTK